MNRFKIGLYVVLFLLVVVLIIYATMNIRERLLPYDPKIDDLKRRLLLVHKKTKDLQFYHDKKSYTINKRKVHLCVKDKDGDYYDDNMLIYA